MSAGQQNFLLGEFTLSLFISMSGCKARIVCLILVSSAARNTAAKLLGIVISQASVPEATELLQQQESTFAVVPTTGKEPPKRYEERSGALSAAGYILAQCSTGANSTKHQVSRNLLICSRPLRRICPWELGVPFLNSSTSRTPCCTLTLHLHGSNSASPSRAKAQTCSPFLQHWLRIAG